MLHPCQTRKQACLSLPRAAGPSSRGKGEGWGREGETEMAMGLRDREKKRKGQQDPWPQLWALCGMVPVLSTMGYSRSSVEVTTLRISSKLAPLARTAKWVFMNWSVVTL